jgi:hypothetical protein
MENQNNYIALEYNEKFQIELIVNNNSPVEDILKKINPLTFFFKNICVNINSFINVIYTLIGILIIYSLKPIINIKIYKNFYHMEYLNRIDFFYVFLPLILMGLVEILFNHLMKNRFYNEDKKIFNELKSLFIWITCKMFVCFACMVLSNNNLNKFNKYSHQYLNNQNIVKVNNLKKPTNTEKPNPTYSYKREQYINYKWTIIHYIYMGAFILNMFLHFFLSNTYESKKNQKYLYIKTQLTEFYTKNGLIDNPITKHIYKELFNK